MSTGQLFGFGDNSEGQCAIPTHRSYEPMEVNTRELLGGDIKTRFVWAGDAHSGLLSEDGFYYVWGDNTVERLGLPDVMSVHTPRLVDELVGLNIC